MRKSILGVFVVAGLIVGVSSASVFGQAILCRHRR
jgi:hypothetical protein